MDGESPYSGITTLLIWVVMVTAAVVGLTAMFIVRSRQRSILLMVLFTGWVLSPFAALTLAHVRSQKWRASTRSILQGGTLIISLGALTMYISAVARPLKSQPASTFILVPLASWVVLAVVAAIAAVQARRG
ncbi:MAG: hypothetical protein M3Z05_11430 [Gemmatimonadota bacterium]|nr:hypothetical protein [Gemmatimonadota bacterium]